MNDKKKDAEGEKSSGKDRDKEGGKEKQPKGEGNNKMMFLGVLAGVIVLNIVIAVVLLKMTQPKAPDLDADVKMHVDSLENEGEHATAMGKTTAEAPIEVLVNIAGTDGERFMKAAVVLEFEEKADPHAPKKKEGGGGHGGGHGGGGAAKSPIATAIEERMPKYKSYLIEHLSKMTLAEVTAPEAKDGIRKDLLRMVNSTLPSELGEVRDIYFTQYIIQ